MTSTWFNVAVVLLWLATMSWLITQKVVPALLVGEPPNYRTVVEAQQDDPLVGWSMSWNERKVGWAIHRTFPLPDDLTEIHSLVHFDHLPREFLPMGFVDPHSHCGRLGEDAGAHVLKLWWVCENAGMPITRDVRQIVTLLDGSDRRWRCVFAVYLRQRRKE